MTDAVFLESSGLENTIAYGQDGPRTVRRLLADAYALAARLPAGSYLLNFCEDRYRFAVGFLAGMLSDKVSMQPSSQTPEVLRQLAAQYPGLTCLTDGAWEAPPNLPSLKFPARLESSADLVRNVPEFDRSRIAAILFTSGSTGSPQPHAKSWGKLLRSGLLEAQHLGVWRKGYQVVATVPVQHSYGFESSFLLPLQAGGSFWAGNPFYAMDIVRALESVPRPRLLVTTPFHLATLLRAGVPVPEIDLVLSATAQLSSELAIQAKDRLGVPVHEIYGSTESGQIAFRCTNNGATWTLFDEVRLTECNGDFSAEGGHVEQPIALSDRLELLSDKHFLLVGRKTDLINIAGKRTSFTYLNHQIESIEGVEDAAFYMPPGDDPLGVNRLTAFVVAPRMTRESLMTALRERIDPAFMPRPLVMIDTLPRNATGKLTQGRLDALYLEKVKRG